MKKILLCIDGSDYTRSACGYAAWLAGAANAEVDALYVSEIWQFETPLIADFGGTIGAQPYLALTSQLQEIEAKKAAVLREACESIFREQGVGQRVRFHHRTGVLVDCIEEFEEAATPADLVVVGKRGEHANFAKGHLGANMERVVRAGSVPVFVANREFRKPDKVAVAYDGSPSAKRAVEWAMKSPVLAGVTVHVVSVARPGEEQAVAEHLAEAARLLQSRGGSVVVQALAGAPGDAIEAYVTSTGINLLLMGAYGHSAVRRFLIGSTTSELVRRCKIPVVMVR